MKRKRSAKSSTTERVDSSLERRYDTLARQIVPDWPDPVRNYKFNLPNTRHEIDRYYPDARVGVELNGGTWGRLGHSTGRGIDRDYEKLLWAHVRGIRLFYISSSMLRRDPGGWLEVIDRFITRGR